MLKTVKGFQVELKVQITLDFKINNVLSLSLLELD